MELADSHCHLFLPPLAAQVDPLLAAGRARGVRHVIVPAFDPPSWPAVTALCARPEVAGALGLHPWAADQDLDVATLRARAAVPGVVAIGEIGLDLGPGRPPIARQLEVLRLQLDLAAALDLPIILHCVRAAGRLLEALAPRAPLRGVVHGFTRGPELAARFTALGLHIGLGLAVTRPDARRARLSARALPLERVLLETDAPARAPVGAEDAEQGPGLVAAVAAALAQERQQPLEQIAAQTTENARVLFRL